MGLPDTTAYEQDVIKFVEDVTEVFFSEEFNFLRKELETFYCSSNMEKPVINAFQDALFTILAERDNLFTYPQICGSEQ